MEEKKERRWVAPMVSSIVALVISLLFTWYELSYSEHTLQIIIKSFADGFFASATFYLGIGLLILIADAGNFYGIQFVFYSLRRTFFINGKAAQEEKKDYYQYTLEKKAKAAEKSNTRRWMMLVIGAVLLMISLVLTAVFYQV